MAIQESFLSKVSDAVRGGTVGKEVQRSAKWFQDKIKGLKGDLRNRFSSTNAAKFYREAETKIQPAVLKNEQNTEICFVIITTRNTGKHYLTMICFL